MQTQTAWATGFLTQLLLTHLQIYYPSQMNKVNPRALFSGVEGYDALKDPQDLLMDHHAWLPEEVLREVLRTAERLSGRKEIAREAAIDYFIRSARQGERHIPSIFEIIARTFDDVRTVALYSGLWAGAYTTFLRLQAVARNPADPEMIVLSQWDPGFHPLLATHFMLKGNYEGFVRLYDFVEEAHLDEEFLQYRVGDIVREFEGYDLEESGSQLKIVKNDRGGTVAVFQAVQLADEEIPLAPPSFDILGTGTDHSAGPQEALLGGMIIKPETRSGGATLLRTLIPRAADPTERIDPACKAYRVTQGGTLRSGSLEYVFREGSFYEAPYSRYRFYWREHSRPVHSAAGLEKRVQKMTCLLFAYLQELKATQQRLLAYAAENKTLTTENVYLRREVQEVNDGWTSSKPMGESPGMKAVLGLVRQVGPTDSTVLITGETGTGKELIARLIHRSGNRSDRRFVAVNCAAVPIELLESELFGHERGAFTGALSRKIGKFEWADGGTLFLDEIGEIPTTVQVKFLRVLQERELVRVGGNDPIKLDVRIIGATNQDLKALIEKGLFRKDLYYRLHVIPIHLPPLRERLEDLQALAEYFLIQFSRRLRKNVQTLSPEALHRMVTYSWPGNIRELENVLERAVTLIPASQTMLIPEFLPPEIRDGIHSPLMAVRVHDPRENKMDGRNVKDVIDRIEWQTLVEAMKIEGSMDSFLRKIEWAMAQRAILEYGSKTEAARVLKRTYRWIRKLEKEMEDKPSA
ncbi:MAG TPA: sigma-54 dependent transcriptional regulator [Nitrospiria bacterium]|jgi:transcriptional regulator with GAF, ATPase, and Fis domain|nr:sigma-54 dependent transcriptional regulator [Nitrospiria bacterium]